MSLLLQLFRWRVRVYEKLWSALILKLSAIIFCCFCFSSAIFRECARSFSLFKSSLSQLLQSSSSSERKNRLKSALASTVFARWTHKMWNDVHTKEKKAFFVSFLKERKNEKKTTCQKTNKSARKEFGKREAHAWHYEFEISIERCGCVQSEHHKRVTLNASNLFYLKTFAVSLLFTHKYLTHT